MMRRAIAHHPASPRPAIPCPPFPVPKLDGTSHGMEYTVGQFGSAVLAVSSPNLCSSSLLTGWAGEAENSLTQSKHYLATAENISVLSTFFAY